MKTVDERVYDCWALVTPAEDLPGQWVAHCLNLDVIAQGPSVQDAMQRLIEATGMIACDDLNRGADPISRRAPEKYWDRLSAVVFNAHRYDPSLHVPELAPAEYTLVIAANFGICVTKPGDRDLFDPVLWAKQIDRDVATA